MKKLTLFAIVGALVLPAAVHAQIVAGDLVVDLRAAALDANSTTWQNFSTSADTVGDFVTAGGANLNVASIGGQPLALSLGNRGVYDQAYAVNSTLTTPDSLEGNNPCSVEAWVYADDTPATRAVVSWGTSGNQQLSSFNYNDGGNGLHSGWFNDTGWDTSTEPLPTGQWVYLAYTWDGTTVSGYINGELNKSADLLERLIADNVLTVGATRAAAADPFHGYIGDVRVHTGVLNPADITANFALGFLPVPIPEPTTLALGGLGLLSLLMARRRR